MDILASSSSLIYGSEIGLIEDDRDARRIDGEILLGTLTGNTHLELEILLVGLCSYLEADESRLV